VIRVIPDSAWTTWVDFMKNDPTASPIEIGERVWKQKCNSCHTIDGGTNTGPTWKDMYGSMREFTDGTSALADDNYIRESILYPSRKVSKGFGNNMTPFVGLITEKQITGVIEFMKKQSVHYKPADAPAADAPAAEAPANGAPAPDAPANPPASGQGPN
jgi:cytochrome c oxidase subunit 2